MLLVHDVVLLEHARAVHALSEHERQLAPGMSLEEGRHIVVPPVNAPHVGVHLLIQRGRVYGAEGRLPVRLGRLVILGQFLHAGRTSV